MIKRQGGVFGRHPIFSTVQVDQGVVGNLPLLTGNLVVGASGKGVDFSIDGQATGMTSELLDDYEEGTFSPNLTNNGTITYTAQYGRYTKIGRQVTIWFYVAVNTVSGGSGVAALQAPFACDAAAVGAFNYAGNLGINTTAQTSVQTPAFYASNNIVYLYDAAGVPLYGVNVTAGCVISGSMTYFV